jgi:uncharacterized membrane protein
MGQPPNIPSPFLRLYSMVAFAIVAYLLTWALTRRRDHRLALRLGMAGGFVLSGVDHFISTGSRYLPMLPDFLQPWGVPLIYFTGVTELAGAVGLVVPLALYRRLGLPDLRYWAGVGITVMLAGLMVANINVAIKATGGHSFAFETWLYWLRLAFQLVFMAWALYAAEVVLRPRPQTRSTQ